jgi:hypothetical protein
MTKAFRLSLSLLLVLVAQPFAQQSPPAADVYERWKEENLLGLPRGVETPHYALAAVTRRVDATRAEVEFFVVGRMSEVEFKIRPKRTEKLPAGEYKEADAGTPVSSTLTLGDGERRGGGGLKIIVPVNEAANAFEVKWTIKGGELGQMNNTGWLNLKDAPSSGIMSIVYGK